jgi:hypothetical protein
MNLWDVIKEVGGEVIKNVVPGGAMLMGVVNELLPDDKKLPVGATGNDVKAAIESLPPTDRARIMEKEIDLDLADIRESHSTLRAMLDSDAKNPQSTRPYIAKHAFHIIAVTSVAIMAAWSYAVYSGDSVMVKQIQEGAIFVVALNGTLATLLLAYFGSIRKEHKQKMDAASGNKQPSGIAGLVSRFLQK